MNIGSLHQIWLIAGGLLCLLTVVYFVFFRKSKIASNRIEKASVTKATWASALQKSREPLSNKLENAWRRLSGNEVWGESHPIWEDLEEALLAADIGPKRTDFLLQNLRKDFHDKPDLFFLQEKLREHMRPMLVVSEESSDKHGGVVEEIPKITLLIGVNGAGKTTTAGKLAYQAKEQGKKVILGAADTFRAAAVEQLKAWAERIGVECITPAQGASPSAVAFDTVAAAISRGADEAIIDTAGRLHTKESLMEELKKLAKVIQKKIPTGPHRVLLILDATQGQNAIAQAKEFTAAIQATGIVLTKLDGSAKGGAVLSIVDELNLPVEFVGLGEQPEDLQKFSPDEFLKNLIPGSEIPGNNNL